MFFNVLKEFREFAVKGNVVDLAVGVIIGGAFGKIVTSLVNDLIMPPIGVLLSGMNFADLFINLDPSKHPQSLKEAQAQGIAVIAYGNFINVILDFTIVSFCVFLLVKAINAVRRIHAFELGPVLKEKDCPHCLSKVPLKATRCKFCTSPLEVEEAQEDPVT